MEDAEQAGVQDDRADAPEESNSGPLTWTRESGGGRGAFTPATDFTDFARQMRETFTRSVFLRALHSQGALGEGLADYK